ncbi:MAG TPA: PIG-L family deacetylase [Streptosporangiaceae bacterium]
MVDTGLVRHHRHPGGDILAGSYAVVSPHLDDAVLSCGLFLAANPGSLVVTAFTHGPPSVSPLPRWDADSRYFPDGADVMAVRRGEDISAAAMASAATAHLGYWDGQYRTREYGYQGMPTEDLPAAIATDLAARAREHPALAWVIPLGIHHPDHEITAEAGLIFAAGHPGPVYLYEELPYARRYPRVVTARRKSLRQHGYTLAPDPAFSLAPDQASKAAVVGCHASQRRALGRGLQTALRSPERIWRLVRR